MSLQDVAQDALRMWGEDAQLGMMVEECGEFIVAVRHFQRGRIDKLAVASEVADVLLMMEQAKLMFGADLVNSELSRKRQRLAVRLEVAEASRHRGTAQ